MHGQLRPASAAAPAVAAPLATASYSSADEEEQVDDDESDSDSSRGSVFDVHAGPLPPAHYQGFRNCPPYDASDITSNECSCANHGQLFCLVQPGGAAYDFLEQKLTEADNRSGVFLSGGCNDPAREANHANRKVLYRHVAHLLDYRAREQIPACCKNRIRQIYPEKDGRYMGFKVQ